MNIKCLCGNDNCSTKKYRHVINHSICIDVNVCIDCNDVINKIFNKIFSMNDISDYNKIIYIKLLLPNSIVDSIVTTNLEGNAYN